MKKTLYNNLINTIYYYSFYTQIIKNSQFYCIIKMLSFIPSMDDPIPEHVYITEEIGDRIKGD